MDSTLSYLRQNHPHSPSSRNKINLKSNKSNSNSKINSPRNRIPSNIGSNGSPNSNLNKSPNSSNSQNNFTQGNNSNSIDNVLSPPPPTTPTKKSYPTTPTKRSFIYSSPIKSPRKNSFSDRFLPLRHAGSGSFDGQSVPVSLVDSQLYSNNTSAMGLENNNVNNSSDNNSGDQQETDESRNDTSKSTYSTLLKNELFGDFSNNDYEIPYISPIKNNGRNRSSNSSSSSSSSSSSNRNGIVLGYHQSKYASVQSNIHSREMSYTLSPIGKCSQKVLISPRKAPRNISKVPFKVLDAPELQDDFYLNLIDWSQQNILAVGLSTCVYLWNACTSQVTKLCDLKKDDDSISSVGWIGRGQYLAVGTFNGNVQIWDAHKGKRMRTMTGHTARVGTLSSKGCLILSGSRDRSILYHDARSPEHWVGKLHGHKQEVCGVKWSPDKNLVASGGNDNKLLVWDINNYGSGPMYSFTEHKAAVKAISWSPHQSGLLASGGGTADRKIRFWSTVTGTALNCIDTGSQVCNLSWSNVANEIVSTHGYSQNQIIVWKYPTMTPIVKLTGHTYRVLYLAMSPCGQTVVTGAGDETLRFWNVFDKATSSTDNTSVLKPFSQIR